MNIAVISGRLGKDPEIRYTTTGTAVSEFQLATLSGYGDKKKTNWISCVAWAKSAEWITEGASKGDELTVEGEIETGSYEGQDGKKVYWTKINVKEFRISKAINRGEEPERDEAPERKSTPKGKGAKAIDPFADDEDD